MPTFVLALPVALLVLAGCSSPPDEFEAPVTASPLPQPAGWILSSGQVFGQGLMATRLPGGQARRMELSNDTPVFGARWEEPGRTAIAFIQPGSDNRELALVRVGLDEEPQPIGTPLTGVSSISAANGTFLAGTCHHGVGTVQVIPSGGPVWLSVARADGCRATLSPQGRSVAFTNDGHSVRAVLVAGGPVATIVDTATLPGLAAAGLRGATITELAWGNDGLAAVLKRGTAYGVAIHTPEGDHLSAIAGSPTFVGALTWQPAGPLVAMATFVQGQGSVLRTMDARTGAVRVLATDPRGLSGTVWSPNGALVASLDSRGTWEFVDGNGNRASLVPVDNEIPLDWAS